MWLFRYVGGKNIKTQAHPEGEKRSLVPKLWFWDAYYNKGCEAGAL